MKLLLAVGILATIAVVLLILEAVWPARPPALRVVSPPEGDDGLLPLDPRLVA